ncbi:hypothetical protein SAMN05216190_11568 [Pseudomonas borbori]|uniref:Uncharacterized protein n=1 Tax=Pseudomonas borbori TaxID=289003 RepID=A0A1I5S8V4_9PSED|nr:hypothetical protein SAMN05216190_11568 [Pseudomonas borbori]
MDGMATKTAAHSMGYAAQMLRRLRYDATNDPQPRVKAASML